LGIPHVDLSRTPVDPRALQLVPERVAREERCLPIAINGQRLTLAVADPFNVVALDEVRQITGMEIQLVLVGESDLERALAQHYGLRDVAAVAQEVLAAVPAQPGPGRGDALAGGSEPDEEPDVERLRQMVEEAPIVRLVNVIISQAVRERASDIHIEPQEHDVRIRYRVDGLLREAMSAPRRTHPGLVSRIKVLAKLDIAQRRLPQDGQIRTRVEGKELDIRVATLPTVYGEKVVLRLLSRDGNLLDLQALGFSAANLQQVEHALSRPYGMILVTGPTGSGKTTTLYAALSRLNATERNIITVEDPVEYSLPGVNQIQVNPKAGLDFATALRAILRQDPDVIMVGEIRDQETARIAVQAALTGHLVLSTLHTNDAAGTLTRLVDMGIEPYLVASALVCVVAQRLVRRVCPDCRESYVPDEAEWEVVSGIDGPALAQGGSGAGEAGVPRPDKPVLYRGRGCGRCGQTGYAGRLAIHEVITVSADLRRHLLAGEPAEAIAEAAVAHGMVRLRQDGLAKALAGQTTLAEVLRATADDG
ncbi:MAG: type II secretion system ATPase GspE, partial [Firmicutes bacterium]|nr:type II secretion system ATPase GspE [Bacillota bacterium]